MTWQHFDNFWLKKLTEKPSCLIKTFLTFLQLIYFLSFSLLRREMGNKTAAVWSGQRLRSAVTTLYLFLRHRTSASLCFKPFLPLSMDQRDGRILTRVLTRAFPCVIKLHTTVFCVHSVLEHEQQQLDLLEALSWAAIQTMASGTVRQGRRHGPSITTQIGHSLPASQAGLHVGSSL